MRTVRSVGATVVRSRPRDSCHTPVVRSLDERARHRHRTPNAVRPGASTWPPSRSPTRATAPAATHDAAAPHRRCRRRSRAVYRAPAASPLVAASAVVLVLVMAQAGAALGGSSLAAPERRPAVSPHVRTTVVAPRRLAVVDRAAPRAGRRSAPGRRRAGRPARRAAAGRDVEWAGSATESPTRLRSAPGRRGCGSPVTARRLTRATASRRRGRVTAEPDGYRGAVRCPYCRPTTTRSSTRARPTTAPRSGAGGSAWRAGAASPPTSGSRSCRSWS